MKKLNRKHFVFDIEADDLLERCTKIHCLSISYFEEGEIKTRSVTDYESMRQFFKSDLIKVGHNIIDYDLKVVEKILGVITDKETVIDTLPLSWYLYPKLTKHGLEEWGNTFGIKKPEIKDWKSLSEQEYIYRCEQDTLINFKLIIQELADLKDIYDDEEECERLIDYLQFKMYCVDEQVRNPLRFDEKKADENLNILTKERENKFEILKQIMPKVPVYRVKKLKSVIEISPGEYINSKDVRYQEAYDKGLDVKDLDLKILKGEEEPNPNSSDQKKNWLYSLGWKPRTFKSVKEKDGSIRKIPQIMSDKKDGSLCDSIIELFEKEPNLQHLENLSILSHRISLIEGLIKSQRDGYIEASMAGLTNTLRLKHKGIVNLPGVNKKYGEYIRSLIIANEDDLLCGSDCSGLEDNCKQHYIYKYDPEYIKEMRVPGFDPHLDICVLSGLLTKEQAEEHKLYEKTKGQEGKSYKPERHKGKTVNFSATYGAGPAKIAETGNFPLKEGKLLHTIYWQRNKAVKQTANDCIVKEIKGQKWLFNPISKLWYSLRAEKDRFSTLNQGTGVWCFDTWVKEIRKRGIIINYQCHDEVLFNINGRPKDEVKKILRESIDETNNIVKLNVPLDISIDFAKNYADCH